MNLPRIYFSICFLLLLNFYGQSQVKYATTDLKNIYKKRKELILANEQWDRKKLYQLGGFFEKIYDKYKDSSMTTAIHCYTIAASSESEYGGRQECYKAAYRLASIYESGKGVAVSFHRAMIYYYLSDFKHQSTYNTLGDPVQNANFQRLKKKYCGRDIVAAYKNGDKIDSVVIDFSPFCKLTGKRIDEALHEFALFLQQNPERTVAATITGDNSIPAAQYTLKVENFLLPAAYNNLVMHLVEKEGVSGDRFLPLKRDFYGNNEGYRIILQIDKKRDLN